MRVDENMQPFQKPSLILRQFLFYILFAFTLALCSVTCTSSVIMENGQKQPLPPPVTVEEETEANIKFIVFGDHGTGQKLQKKVAEGMRQMKLKYGTDFILGVGDNFYPRYLLLGSGGVKSIEDKRWNSRFENIYDSTYFNIDFFMTLGNHDYEKNELAQVKYSKEKNSRWKMNNKYYPLEKNIGNKAKAAFFALDTNPFIYQAYFNADTVRNQLEAIDRFFNRSNAQWKIVFGHHSPRSNGGHGNAEDYIETEGQRDLWKKLIAILKTNQVNVFFAGHDHDVQALVPEDGIHFFVSGGAGKHRDVHWKTNTQFALTNGGFIWCRMTANKLLVVICDKNGIPRWKTIISN